MATRYDIVVPKKYEKNGEEKTSWKNVGTLVRFPATEEKEEGYIMELNMYPDVTFKIFKQKEKEEQKQQEESRALKSGYMKNDTGEADEEYSKLGGEVAPEDIPW